VGKGGEHTPTPLSRGDLPSPLVAYGSEPTAQRGEGKGEGVMDFCKSLTRKEIFKK